MSPRIRSRRCRLRRLPRCERLADILRRVTVPKDSGPDAERALASVKEFLRRADQATELVIRELIDCIESTVPSQHRSRLHDSLRQLSQGLHDLMDRREYAAYLIGRATVGGEDDVFVKREEDKC
jgi:hypothetical protein